MEAFWNDLSTRKQAGRLTKDEEKFFKKWVKALGYLSQNPKHNSLGSHEIDDLTRKYGIKVFQSFSEIKRQRLAECFGLMARREATLQCLELSRILRTKSVARTERIKLSSVTTKSAKSKSR